VLIGGGVYLQIDCEEVNKRFLVARPRLLPLFVSSATAAPRSDSIDLNREGPAGEVRTRPALAHSRADLFELLAKRCRGTVSSIGHVASMK
jgi:hypothetical protein